jgi:hypothetical protein
MNRSRLGPPTVLLSLLAAQLAAASLAAQELSPDENHVEARGFAPGKLYDFGGVDSINNIGPNYRYCK